MTATVLPFPAPPKRPHPVQPQPAEVVRIEDRRPVQVPPGIILWSALMGFCFAAHVAWATAAVSAWRGM